MGIIKKVPLNENIEPGTIHYLPKVLVVFDPSSKQSDGPSLNDLLFAGPCLLPNFYEILLRFSCGKIALVADTNKHFSKSKLISLIVIFYDSSGTIL